MRISGIYGIFNLVDAKAYVGSTVDLDGRWQGHKLDLIKGRHVNKYLQNAWNKYGEINFEFRILEQCQEDMLLIREDSWIEYYHCLDSNFGYNLMTARRTFCTLENRKARSDAAKGEKNSMFGKHHSEETKAKIGRTNGAKKRTDEQKKAMSVRSKLIQNTPEVKKRKSDRAKGDKNPNYGKHRKHTEEAKQRISATMKELRRLRPWSSRKKNISLAS